MSEYDGDALDMVGSYLRRQRMLAQMQAGEIGRLFYGESKAAAPANAMGGTQTVVGASGKRYTQVSADVLLARAMAP